MLNEYEISYWDDEKTEQHPRGRRVVYGQAKAPNGISAIKLLLTRMFAGDKDLTEAVMQGRELGIKRFYVAGVTFEAKKL